MISLINLIKCIILVTLFISCQIQATTFNNDESEMVDLDTIRELIPNSQDQFYHQQYRRASLRYHPHILYKKASLKPIIGHHGKVVLSERDRY